MVTTKDFFKYVALTHGIYLTKFHLKRVWSRMKPPHFEITPEFEIAAAHILKEERFQLLKDPLNGAYVVEPQHKVWVKAVSIPVEQLHYITGEVIAEFPSIRAAALTFNAKATGCANIKKACVDKSRQAYGYSWRFKK